MLDAASNEQHELGQLSQQLEALTQFVKEQQAELTRLKTLLPQTAAETFSAVPVLEANGPKSNRRRMLRRLATGLVAGVAAAGGVAALSESQVAEAKFVPGGSVGAVVVLPGASVSGTLPANKIGLFATTDNSTNLSNIPPATLGNSGVVGYSATSNRGVSGFSSSGIGVYGDGGNSGIGVFGQANQSSGVYGANTFGAGVTGNSTNGKGVDGTSQSGSGVEGTSVEGYGVYGFSTNDDGVFGKSFHKRGLVGDSTNGVPLRLIPGPPITGGSSNYIPQQGDIYIGTGANSNKMYLYDGAAWRSITFS